MKQFTITENDSQQRVDKFLTKAVPTLPKTLMYKYIRTKRIKLNGKRCEISTRLIQGDILELYVNDEFFLPATETEEDFLKAPPEISVVYEDDRILLVNKPVGLVVHHDNEHTVDTLIHRVLHYLFLQGSYNPQEENSFIPALCNRIDRNTSGIVIVAKTAEASRELNLAIKMREVEKHYLCIVHGVPSQKQALLKHFLEKDSDSNTVRILENPTSLSKTVLTRYSVLESRNGFSLLDVELLTGRTHQIRAHLAYVGHPLLGDTKYGRNRDNKDLGYKYQALCAYQLAFQITDPLNPLYYLNEKTFCLDTSKIDFVKRFYEDGFHSSHT